jgi:hypothetical protein
LSKERNPPLGLTSTGEELALEPLISLGDEERRRSETATTILTGVDLVVQ